MYESILCMYISAVLLCLVPEQVRRDLIPWNWLAVNCHMGAKKRTGVLYKQPTLSLCVIS